VYVFKHTYIIHRCKWKHEYIISWWWCLLKKVSQNIIPHKNADQPKA
jgi:hypothetical protein